MNKADNDSLFKALNEQYMREQEEEQAVAGEVVTPIIDPELGYESEFEPEQLDGKSYIGKSVCFCNICQAAFFSDEEVNEETQCPVCGSDYKDIETVGIVRPKEEEPKEEPQEEQPKEEPKENEEGQPEEQPKENPEEQPKEEPEKKESFEFAEQNYIKLVENFLRDNYEDLVSVKVESIRRKPKNKLFIETFAVIDGGIEKQINFLTDSIDFTKEGKISVKAGCHSLSKRNKKGFTFEGVLKDKKVIFEKLSYNYDVIDDNKNKFTISGKTRI